MRGFSFSAAEFARIVAGLAGVGVAGTPCGGCHTVTSSGAGGWTIVGTGELAGGGFILVSISLPVSLSTDIFLMLISGR